MIDEILLHDIALLFIGAIITLIATIILFIFQQLITRHIKRRGEVSIYYKYVFDLMNGDPASFKNRQNTLTIPLWLEIHNNKEVNQVVRNVNLALYSSGKLVDKAIQANFITKAEDKIYLGNNGSYSFNLPPESIHQFEVYYIFKKSAINKEFDSVYLTYYMAKDKMIKSKILYLKDGWNTEKLELAKDWVNSKSKNVDM